MTGVAVTAGELVEAGERRVMALLDVVRTKRADATHFRDVDPRLGSFTSGDTPEAHERALLRIGT